MTHDPDASHQSPPPSPEPEPSLQNYPPPVAPWPQQTPPGPVSPYGAQPGGYAGQGPYVAPGPYGDQGGGYLTPPSVYGQYPAVLATKPDPMPDGPREYQHMLRGPRFRWWKPLVALALAAGIALPLMLLAYVPVVLAGLVAGIPDPVQWAAREIVRVDNLGPAGFFYVNLSLIVLIPTAGLSIWAVHRIRPRFVTSVQGGFRWRWLLRCLVVVVPVWLVYLGVGALLDPTVTARPAQWGLLLVIVVFLTPLQAAGEEYFFRGWIMQNVGSWFRHPIVGLVVSLAVSVTAFSAAHGSPNIWVLGDLGVFALTAGLATWRTGGLEAGIAIHAVNNIGVFFTVILFGGWQQAFVGSDTTSTPADFGISLLVHAVVLSLILWQAKRAGIQRLYLPPATPGVPTQAAIPTGYSQPLLGQ